MAKYELRGLVKKPTPFKGWSKDGLKTVVIGDVAVDTDVNLSVWVNENVLNALDEQAKEWYSVYVDSGVIVNKPVKKKRAAVPGDVKSVIEKVKREFEKIEDNSEVVDDKVEEKKEVSVEKEIKVDVGVMEATVKAGDDGELGTSDDKVELKPKRQRRSRKQTKVVD